MCINGNAYNNIYRPSTSNTHTTSRLERKTTETPKQSFDLFSKISTVMKTKTSEVKGKLIDYIVNPSTTTAQHEIVEKHV